jgi:hypothetical protein
MLEYLDTLADFAQKIAATLAFLAGGFWVLMNYRRNRTHVPRLQTSIAAEILEGPSGRYLLASMEVRNPGQSKIELREEGHIPKGTALVVRPLFTDARHLTEPVEAEETAFDILSDHNAIEPGLVVYEQKLISIPDRAFHAFHVRLRVIAHDQSWSASAVAFAKDTPRVADGSR